MKHFQHLVAGCIPGAQLCCLTARLQTCSAAVSLLCQTLAARSEPCARSSSIRAMPCNLRAQSEAYGCPAPGSVCADNYGWIRCSEQRKMRKTTTCGWFQQLIFSLLIGTLCPLAQDYHQLYFVYIQSVLFLFLECVLRKSFLPPFFSSVLLLIDVALTY